MCLPGGGYGSVRVELPYNWDKLMEAKGYAPLRSFYLTPRKTSPQAPPLPLKLPPSPVAAAFASIAGAEINAS